MSSQIKSTSGQHYTTRSMNGIISYDDGAGNIIEGGTITSNGVVVDGDVEANNLLEADENETITGTWSFTSIPYSTITPTLDTHIANKLYVDTEANTKVSKSGDETINGIKTFIDSPIVPNPTTATQVANKDSYETFGYSTFASLTDNNTLTGINSFSNQVYLPNSNQTNDLMSASKGYVDTFGYTTFASLTDNNTLTGINSFNQQVYLPNSNQTNALMASSKGYVDAQIAGIDYSGFVDIANNQTITGTKTYNTGLRYDLAPVVNTDVVNKLALDNAISGIPAPSGVVLTTTNQNVGGVKTFTDTLLLNTTGTSQTIKLWNGNGNEPASTAMGINALNSVTTGENNSAFGISTLNILQSGNSNTAFGAYALSSSITNSGNTAVGSEALKVNIGSTNTSVGASSLLNNISGHTNTALGAYTLNNNTTGIENVAIGSNALYANIDGNYNVAIGRLANDNNTTADNNIAIGYRAMRNKTGEENIYIGANTGADTSATGANDNVVIGHNSGQYITGEKNTIIGGHAGQGMSSAYRNTIIGNSAGQNVDSSCITSVFLGYYTGIVTGSGATNVVCIGNGATTSRSNIVVLGSGNIVTYCPYRIGIGTNVPKASLEINNTLSKTYGNINDPKVTYFSFNANGVIGQFNFNASNAYYLSIITDGAIFSETYTGASDIRIKENIVEVDDETSLQMIRDIPCRYYEYKDKIGKGFTKTIGFISQDVEKILPMAVSQITRHIPNEYRVLENITWTDGDVDVSGNVINYKMSCDLIDVSGKDYKFFLTNSTDDEKNTELNIVGNSDNTFTFTDKYNHVFCYGEEVDDFRALDKNKIFALHHSGIQEIDKQQLADKARITELETQVSDLTTRLQALEAHFNQ